MGTEEGRLARAAEGGDAAGVARLLAEGAQVDDPNPSSWRTPLDLAVHHGHLDVVRLLIHAGTDLAQRVGEYHETSPLCLAAMRGHADIAEALLDAGVHPDALDRMGQPPLVLAATSMPEGHPRTVDLLLDRGADIEATLRDRTALGWAACFGHPRMVGHLLARGATPTPQALACAGRHTERDREAYPRIAEALRAADAGAP
ncbi:ankyrin repeat domain-containing protein [Streptomyces sp. NPDC020802]|uniref:ankyrin repeat domain-containing protein n=1 Tax=Streptomyces sp. NPDC020802 TaxID=3365094 RepID=UPI00378B6BE5